MSAENCLYQVRPDSAFETFQPFTEEQLHGWTILFNVANQIIDHGEVILSEPYPFPTAKWVAITGNPGRGKSHLLEAFVNHIGRVDGALLNKLFLSRSNFTTDNLTFADKYGNSPIILIDDIFVEHQSVTSLHPRTDIESFFTFLKRVYEKRLLVISTCNFSFIDHVFPLIKQVDLTGRYLSRFSEISGNFGEINLNGPDYRQFNAMGSSVKPFDLFS